MSTVSGQSEDAGSASEGESPFIPNYKHRPRPPRQVPRQVRRMTSKSSSMPPHFRLILLISSTYSPKVWRIFQLGSIPTPPTTLFVKSDSRLRPHLNNLKTPLQLSHLNIPIVIQCLISQSAALDVSFPCRTRRKPFFF